MWLCLYAAIPAPPPCHSKNPVEDSEELNEDNDDDVHDDDDEAVREGASPVPQGWCGFVDHVISHVLPQ